MNKRALDLYAVLAAVLIAPLSLYLWARPYPGNKALALTAWGIPILQG
jgi:hypothetical protein